MNTRFGDPAHLATSTRIVSGSHPYKHFDYRPFTFDYRRIREGSLFLEEIGAELNALDSQLDERFRNFETMRNIAQKIDKMLPEVTSPPEQILSALEATFPFLETFKLAKANVERLNTELLPSLEALVKKADKVHAASGDADSRQVMVTYVDGKDRYFQDEFSKLNQETTRIDARREELEAKLAASGSISASITNESE